MSNPWIKNKGRKRAPYARGTLIDVKMRLPEGAIYTGDGEIVHSPREGFAILTRLACGFTVDDFNLTGGVGDILEYRLHAEEDVKDGEE